jgi:plastocyanin
MCVAAAAPVAAGPVTGVVRTTTRAGVPAAPAIVYAEPIDTVAPRAPARLKLSQKNKTFQPRLLPVPIGSSVDFPNNDGIFHNVFSLSTTKRFDVGLYKDGDTRELKFEKPGIVRLACNIHAQMAGYILVVDAPHYVVVDGTKEFNFRSLAPGKYRVRAWSERSAAPTESEIVIKPGANTMTFDLKGGAEPGPSEDKFGMTRQPAKPDGGR